MTGTIVLLALGFFTPYLSFIPTPALGAIVICAVIHFIEHEEAVHVWKTKSKCNDYSTNDQRKERKMREKERERERNYSVLFDKRFFHFQEAICCP